MSMPNDFDEVWVDDFDEPRPDEFWRGSALERMTSACEDATDDFVKAQDAHSEREAAYLRAYHTAWAMAIHAGAKSKADADRQAEHESVEEHIAEKDAERAAESAKAMMRTRLAILSAAQSHLRAQVSQS